MSRWHQSEDEMARGETEIIERCRRAWDDGRRVERQRQLLPDVARNQWPGSMQRDPRFQSQLQRDSRLQYHSQSGTTRGTSTLVCVASILLLSPSVSISPYFMLFSVLIEIKIYCSFGCFRNLVFKLLENILDKCQYHVRELRFSPSFGLRRVVW